MENKINDCDDKKCPGPQQLLKLVNDKCTQRLGYKVIRCIYTSLHHKTVVEFMNDEVLNFSCYRAAFDHFNVAYNLHIVVKNKNKPLRVIEVNEDDVSKVDMAKLKLMELIRSFQNSKNIELNNITLSDYFNSNEWKQNRFNRNEIDTIIGSLRSLENKINKKYIEHIKKIAFV